MRAKRDVGGSSRTTDCRRRGEERRDDDDRERRAWGASRICRPPANGFAHRWPRGHATWTVFCGLSALDQARQGNLHIRRERVPGQSWFVATSSGVPSASSAGRSGMGAIASSTLGGTRAIRLSAYADRIIGSRLHTSLSGTRRRQRPLRQRAHAGRFGRHSSHLSTPSWRRRRRSRACSGAYDTPIAA
jgi:hypothetical protein